MQHGDAEPEPVALSNPARRSTQHARHTEQRGKCFKVQRVAAWIKKRAQLQQRGCVIYGEHCGLHKDAAALRESWRQEYKLLPKC